MKKILRSIVAVLLVCVVMCSLLACTLGLKGTYVSADSLLEHSITFKDDNKVDVSIGSLDVEGEYTIEDGEITITYSILGLEYDWVKSFERKGSSIFIDGTEYVKQK